MFIKIKTGIQESICNSRVYTDELNLNFDFPIHSWFRNLPAFMPHVQVREIINFSTTLYTFD